MPPATLTNGAGTRADLTSGGALRALEVDGLSVLQYPASELEDGLAGLVVRVRDTDTIRSVSLFGQNAVSVALDDGSVRVARRWAGLEVTARFRLADDVAGWFWSVRVSNTGAEPVAVDVVHTQDVALAPYGAVRTNELYVSQYLDLTPVEVPGHGVAVAVRQNMPGERAPWALVGCLGVAERWSTDALQLAPGDGSPGGAHDRLPDDLPALRRQHEHTLVGLQTPVTILAPGASIETGFYGLVLGDHPAATTPDDARHAETALGDPAAAAVMRGLDTDPRPAADHPTDNGPDQEGRPVSLFARSPELVEQDLSLSELAALAGVTQDWAEVESDGGVWLAAFAGRGLHAVSAAKERRVLRPHGHVMRTGAALTPDERSVTTTTWMRGGFHSQVTQGHVARGSVLSLRRSYLDLFRANGIRVFVAPAERPDDWCLLGMPSAWAVEPDRCRWWYRDGEGTLEVTSSAPADDHAIGLTVRVVEGTPRHLLVALHVALGDDDGAAAEPPGLETAGTTAELTPPSGGDRAHTYPRASVELAWTGADTMVARDEPLFGDGRSRDLPWVTLSTPPVHQWSLTMRPRLVSDEPGPDRPAPAGDPGSFWTGVEQGLRLHGAEGSEVARIDAVLPWFAHDALVHYLAPRGLEQYTGGGWGTRDVSQGPVGLLLALGDHIALRDVVVRLLRAQHARGDWPQAFDFLARHRSLTVSDAHGDVVYWPLLAIGDYLNATGDATLLMQDEPMVADGAETAPVPFLQHLVRALDLVEASRIPGTTLPAYGHGDWNDSLQPADPALAAALCSTWTVTLQAQALRTLAAGLEGLAGLDGLDGLDDHAGLDVAARARRIADEGVTALREQLLVDDVLAGYGRMSDGAVVEHLIHPRDERTGLTYSVLPMIHAITADLLTPQEAHHHLALVHTHLTGPDGVRLFDRPAAYHGGPMQVFQRAEASTFFGREIGIMYTHAHLRYAEALARLGDGAGLLTALAWVNPVGMPERVAPARRRQSTTYFSSSDAAFPDRATADRDYGQVRDGTVPLEGGWRVYSSGPGLYLRLVRECLLGVRMRGRVVEVDPVLPPSLDGLTATVSLFGRPVEVAYRVGSSGHGTTRVCVGDQELDATPLENRYRPGGLGVSADRLRRLLEPMDSRDTGTARIDVEVG